MDAGLHTGHLAAYLSLSIPIWGFLFGIGVGWSWYDMSLFRLRIMDRGLDRPPYSVYICELAALGFSAYIGYLECGAPDDDGVCDDDQ